jgi:hypothetical protein
MCYIITKEDLKNLCLTSRAFHAHTIPRLYEHIDIRLFGHFKVTRFVRCVAASAGMNLRYTRTLVIEDNNLLPVEPESIHSGQIALPTLWRSTEQDYPESTRDIHLRTILQHVFAGWLASILVGPNIHCSMYHTANMRLASLRSTG